jgi:hypothetical protein
VLVHVYNDEVNQYTKWKPNGPHLDPTPFLIKGNPYRIVKEKDEGYRTTIGLQ